jgi:sec-independent protein translocase protein TatC
MTTSAPRLPPGAPEPENEVRLSFVEHLRELRKRLLHAIYGILAGMALIGWFVPRIFDGLMAPVLAALPEGERALYSRNAVEPWFLYLKVAIYGGLFMAAPWVLWQLWLFVAPGLYRRERKVVLPFLFFGTLLFYAGAAFCYFVVLPPAFPALLSIIEGTAIRPLWAPTEQLSIVLAMVLGFGIVFEVPVIIGFLSMTGLVSWRFLAKYRRHAIIANVALAAIITPTGDPVNLALMAVPLILFYEIGIVLARILGKKPAPAGKGAT